MSNILLDPYDNRSLDEYVNNKRPIEPFVMSKLFSTIRPHGTDVVDYEEFSYTNKIAQIVSSNTADPKPVKKNTEKETKTWRIARTYESKTFTMDEIDDMNPPGNLYGSEEAKTKYAQNRIADEVEDLQDRVVNLREKMACEAIVTGKNIITQDDCKLVYDYGFEVGKQIQTAAIKWSSATSNPLTDLKNIGRSIRTASGMRPDLCIMGSAAAELFINHAKVREALNTLNYKVGALDINNPNDSSAELIARMLGYDIYEYNQQYTNSLNAQADMIPSDAVVCLASKSKGFILHKGVIYRLEGKGKKIPMSQDYYMTSKLNDDSTALVWKCEQKSVGMIHDKGAVVSFQGVK